MIVTVVEARDARVTVEPELAHNGTCAELRMRSGNDSLVVRMSDDQVREMVAAGNRYLDRRMVEQMRVVQEQEKSRTAPVQGAAR